MSLFILDIDVCSHLRNPSVFSKVRTTTANVLERYDYTFTSIVLISPFQAII